MSDDQWETTSWDARRDPWFTEPPWPTDEYAQLIPAPRRSTEWDR